MESHVIERNLRPGHDEDTRRATGAPDDASERDRGVPHDAAAGEIDLAFLRNTRIGVAPSPGLQVTIADHAGRVILSSTVDLPTLIHASLAQGAYTVVARSGDTIRLRDFDVFPGKTGRVLFEWDA
jgi:hypothetical protein